MANSSSGTYLNRLAMPFGNKKKIRGSFQFRIVTIQKIITLQETWNLII